MKFTKLSLVAALAVSAAVAGGDIEEVVVVEEVPKTTISGKLTGYYISYDGLDTLNHSFDLFDSHESQFALAATLDVTHNFTENIAMNFTALGYTNTMHDSNLKLEGFNSDPSNSGAIFNVANVTATFMDTTFILGRQLLNTPMLTGFDWLLAPGAFEAYTFANSTFENVTLIGSFVRTWRVNNTGDNFLNLDGDNWTLSAAYDNKTISGSVWYYNVDAFGEAVFVGPVVTKLGKYSQVYADAGYNFDVAKIDAQYVNTNYGTANVESSNVYGIKGTATLGQFNLMAAYVNVADNIAGWVGNMDGLYTSSWNTPSGGSLGNNFKVEAGTEFVGVSASISYAYYEYKQLATATEKNDGNEFDLILGYNITDAIDANLIYTNSDYGEDKAINGIEIYANYKF
jgi:hypothetical protein